MLEKKLKVLKKRYLLAQNTDNFKDMAIFQAKINQLNIKLTHEKAFGFGA